MEYNVLRKIVVAQYINCFGRAKLKKIAEDFTAVQRQNSRING